LVSTTTYQNNKAIREVGSSKVSPFLIEKQINVVAFQLELLGFMRIHLVFHVPLLEPYHASTILGKIHDPPLHIEIDGEHEYEVEDI
jgi:hypothetical protein